MEFTPQGSPGSFAEFTLSPTARPFASLRVTVEGLRMTRQGLRITGENIRMISEGF
jgi:hypothetical protein